MGIIISGVVGATLFLAGCAAVPPSSTATPTAAPSLVSPARPSSSPGGPPSGSAATSPSAASSESVGPAGGCRPTLAADVLEALESSSGYRYEAEGFVYQPVFDPDPLATPSTERVQVAFEGTFAPPDRSSQRYLEGAPELEPEETRQIGRDLWLRTAGGWEELPDAADPARANLLVTLVEDVATPWEAGAGRGGDVCLLTAVQPLPGEGERSVVVQLTLPRPQPDIIRVEVMNAFDPAGERHDSSLTFRVEHDPGIRVDEPS